MLETNHQRYLATQYIPLVAIRPAENLVVVLSPNGRAEVVQNCTQFWGGTIKTNGSRFDVWLCPEVFLRDRPNPDE